MTESTNEKRNFTRVPLGNSFLLRLQDSEYTGKTVDISPGGLRLVEIEPEISRKALGQQGILFFQESVKKEGIKCEIKHIDDLGVGVSFCEK